MSGRQRLQADLVLVAITAVWGATFMVVKDSVALADPFSFLALRFLVGAVALSVIAGMGLAHKPSVFAGMLLGGVLFASFAFQTGGLVFTTPSRSAFLTGLSVLLVPFTAIAILGRRPKPTSIAGVVIAAIGLYALTGGLADTGAATWRGDLLTLGCAVGFAFHITLTERYAASTRIAAMVAVQLWTVAVLSAAVSLIRGPHVHATSTLWFGIVFCGLFASAAAFVLQTWAQVRTTAVRTALIFSLEPVFAAGTAVGFGREKLGERELIGGALIVLGLIVSEVGGAIWAGRQTG